MRMYVSHALSPRFKPYRTPLGARALATKGCRTARTAPPVGALRVAGHEREVVGGGSRGDGGGAEVFELGGVGTGDELVQRHTPRWLRT